MIPRPEPDYAEITRRIVAVAQPERIILFGSRARGDHRPDSDIDLLVVMKRIEDRGKMMVGIRNAIGEVGYGVDVVVYNPQEVRERADWDSSVISWALREGKQLYERAKRRSQASAAHRPARL